MKKIFKINILIIILIANTFAFSQSANRKWAVGLNFGTKEYYGDLGSEFWTFINNHGGLGVNVSRYLNKSFDAYGTYSRGLIDFNGGKGSFETNLNDYNLTIKYKFNNGYFLKEDNIFLPFVFIGVGGTYSEAKHYDGNENEIDFGIPIGLGANIKLTDALAIELRTLTKYSLSDNLDNNQDSPFENNFGDIFNYHSIGIVYSFGKSDKDKDGISDNKDKCPEIAGELNTNGCPDQDKDGVADIDDKCPTIAGKLNGCPDTDGDKVADKDDDCPNTPGSVFGCPDTDNDNFIDKDDDCPNIKGTVKGCPDADADGFADKDDKCPNLIGINQGCPDKDGDGVYDSEDKCPTIKGSKNTNGCPDKDKDGVSDKLDLCPDEFGLKEDNGCPKVKKEEQEVLTQAMKGLFFNSGSAVIKKESYAVLNKVVTIMKANDKINLSIEGHTDNTGNTKKNLTLSKDRAKAARKYLINKGINPSKIFAIGYGDSRPVAENTTPEGRVKNRRVEFVVLP